MSRPANSIWRAPKEIKPTGKSCRAASCRSSRATPLGGTPIEVFNGFRAALGGPPRPVLLDVPGRPFYGFNRPEAQVSQGTIQNWWRQGMMGSAQAHYHGIKAFSETDQSEDLKAITVPTLILQGDDDQVVPYKNAAMLQEQLSADVINQDLLVFIRA